MRVALLTFLCGALVNALTGEEDLEKWGGPRGGNKVSHGGNNIGNGDGGGIDIDTGGGDIGDIGVGVGGGRGGGVCDPAACDAKVANRVTATTVVDLLVYLDLSLDKLRQAAPVSQTRQIVILLLLCASGLTCCNGACVNLDTDASNCGTCGNTCPAGSTSSCSSGSLTCLGSEI
ncbi:hypothetical protein PENARI_c092G11985 [Penicillium arizonense]|uniref:4Fe-4S ferredoxin-type domain-containing protein n=1 Tax=Penicillium arizonense TaxID=1835702 RepID=A0A1F5L1R4_PENAI|nr:hypothetical protein PENARI_c092G11985 [Penicillium arizonense]OGE46899.1 hypothetical protein PENARI_c092G11985 [Penicillium arizonense]